MEMTTEKFDKTLVLIELYAYKQGVNDGDREKFKMYENLIEEQRIMMMMWYDWAQPLIELGIQTQQAQEQAQQAMDWKSIPEVIQPDEIKLFRENPDRDW
jgi:hypothetical protein